MFWRSNLNLRPGGLAVAAFVLFVCAPAYGQSMPGYQAPDKPKAAELSASEKAAQGKAPLSKLYGHLITDPAKVKRLPALDPSEKLNEVKDKIVRIGVLRSLAAPLDPLTDSAIYSVPEGDVRVGAIVSDGALYTRVHFKEMALPAGARVFVYSLANPDEYYGPYEGHGLSADGTFWTPPMKGDGVVIEYFVPKGAGNSQNAPFKVSEVAHVYADPLDLKVGGCHNDVAAPWTDTAKSVARLDFVTSQGAFLCTGTLLADTVAGDIPYVLTANHCFSTQPAAQSLRVYWNYNTGNSPPGGTPVTDGADLLATGTSSDFTFVRLTGTLPGGLFFSGWDAATFSGSAAAAGIHHPDGSYKRISFGTARQPTSQAECTQFGTGFQCLAVDWSSGVTEPGSSGSGVWKGLPTDPGGAKLIGTLTGGPSACGAPPANLKDFYGRFSVTHPSVSAFLDGSAYTPKTLTIASTNPNTGATINVNPSDNGGLGNGTTQFTRTYNFNTTVALTAASTAGGNFFQKWQKDGVDWSTNTTTFVTTDANRTMTAVYVTPANFVLTVGSSNPDSGVNITISPNDNGGQSSGATQFTRTYTQNTTVTLTAPFIAPNGNLFRHWQVNGQNFATSQFHITMIANSTMIAVYTPPATFSLTVASSNPAAGVNITVSPNDHGGQSNGTTQFTRSYTENTVINLTAPAAASNGNIFHLWLKNGSVYSIGAATSITIDSNLTLTATYLTKPVIYAEEGTNNAAALDSVTFLRGPFRLLNPNNFSADQRTRIILFTSDLGLNQQNPNTLSVQVPGYFFTVERVGTLSGVPGLSGSYIIARLPDDLPTGALQLTIMLNSVPSDARTLNIVP